MISPYKTKTNHYQAFNKKPPVNKKIYKKIQTDPNSFNQNFKRNISNYLSVNDDDYLFIFLSKALSKKKKRGVLDISSLGNKDVLTDSDSELPPSSNS